MDTEINELELILISKAASPIECLPILQDLKAQQTNHARLDSNIHDLELDAARLQGEYDVLNTRYAC